MTRSLQGIWLLDGVELVLSCECKWWIDRRSSRHVASGDDNVGANQDPITNCGILLLFGFGLGVVSELIDVAKADWVIFRRGAEYEIDSLQKRETELTVLYILQSKSSSVSFFTLRLHCLLRCMNCGDVLVAHSFTREPGNRFSQNKKEREPAKWQLMIDSIKQFDGISCSELHEIDTAALA